MKVLIDNGHGCDTPGKRSPDGRLREYAYTREIAARLADILRLAGIETECIVPEEYDVPLDERARRANRIYDECNRDAILVSIHCNAAGDGSRWMSARGWSVYVDNYASFNSCNLASTMSKAANEKGVKVRTPSWDMPYWQNSLYICNHTNCPAVLVENFFQDNMDDVDYLLSEDGKQTVTDIMARGIIDYVKEMA